MIIVLNLDVREEVVLICTSCYMQQPIALHKIFHPVIVGKCEVCSKIDKRWTIISHFVSGVAHLILSDIGPYRIVMIDRIKENSDGIKSRNSIQP